MPRVAVLGAGSWGTALAVLAASQADTYLWARDAAVVQGIQTTRRHPRHLQDVALPSALHATADLQTAVQHALSSPHGLLILGAPVAGLEDLCTRLDAVLKASRTPSAGDSNHGPKRKPCLAECGQARQPASEAETLPESGRTSPSPARGKGPHNRSLAILWTCKGFHPDTGELPHQIVERHLGTAHVELGVLSGPSFAHEVAQGLPVALTVASRHAWAARSAVAALHGSNARIYSSTDVVGVEVGGALKNVMAIACGIADGLGLGENARAALITRALAEMQRLGLALGGQAQTFAGLTGVGDLVLTATGKSRNRQVGLAIAAGQPLAQILASGMTAEGVRCARAAQALGRRHAVNMPITDAVCRVLFENVAPRQAVSDLLAREARAEDAA